MYVGKIVEIADTEELFNNIQHPYTEALLSSAPTPDPRAKRKHVPLEGEVPDPANPPSGCYFHPRCQYAKDLCKTETPLLRETKPGHLGGLSLFGGGAALPHDSGWLYENHAALSPELDAQYAASGAADAHRLPADAWRRGHSARPERGSL